MAMSTKKLHRLVIKGLKKNGLGRWKIDGNGPSKHPKILSPCGRIKLPIPGSTNGDVFTVRMLIKQCTLAAA